MTDVFSALFNTNGSPELLYALNQLLFGVWFHLPPYVLLQFVQIFSIGLQSGDSGGVFHQLIDSAARNSFIFF